MNANANTLFAAFNYCNPAGEGVSWDNTVSDIWQSVGGFLLLCNAEITIEMTEMTWVRARLQNLASPVKSCSDKSLLSAPVQSASLVFSVTQTFPGQLWFRDTQGECFHLFMPHFCFLRPQPWLSFIVDCLFYLNKTRLLKLALHFQLLQRCLSNVLTRERLTCDDSWRQRALTHWTFLNVLATASPWGHHSNEVTNEWQIKDFSSQREMQCDLTCMQCMSASVCVCVVGGWP